MSYTPNDWKTGDVVTSTKLNNIENGISNAEPFIVTITPNEQTNETECDKTISEIFDAFDSGKNIYLHASVIFDGDVNIRRLYLSGIHIYSDGERELEFNDFSVVDNAFDILHVGILEKTQPHIFTASTRVPLPEPEENPFDHNAS